MGYSLGRKNVWEILNVNVCNGWVIGRLRVDRLVYSAYE